MKYWLKIIKAVLSFNKVFQTARVFYAGCFIDINHSSVRYNASKFINKYQLDVLDSERKMP